MATSDNPKSTTNSVTKTVRGLAGRVTDRLRGDDTPDADRRSFLRKSAGAGVAATVGLSAASGSASAGDFGDCDFSRTDDSRLPFSTGGQYGGWGGANHWDDNGSVDDAPVVFVHGNGGDACNFDNFANNLLDNGMSGDELWSITFPEFTATHDEMIDFIDDFVQKVMNETGASSVQMVSHSQGVTGVRVWMEELNRYGWVDTFVGMGGPNHGVCVCPGCYDTTLGVDYDGVLGAGETCSEIAVQCFSIPGHLLYEINLPDETPGNIDYYTIRGVYDPMYGCNIFSPYLSGADNSYVYRHHLGMLEETGEIEERVSYTSGSGGSDDGGGGGGWYGWW